MLLFSENYVEIRISKRRKGMDGAGNSLSGNCESILPLSTGVGSIGRSVELERDKSVLNRFSYRHFVSPLRPRIFLSEGRSGGFGRSLDPARDGKDGGAFLQSELSFVKFFKNMLDFAEDMSILCIDIVNTFAG